MNYYHFLTSLSGDNMVTGHFFIFKLLSSKCSYTQLSYSPSLMNAHHDQMWLNIR